MNDKVVVWVRKIIDRKVDAAVREIMELCKWKEFVPRNGNVLIKPNFSSIDPERLYAVNTNIIIINTVCEVLLEKTRNITICESNGMHHKTNAAFDVMGIRDIISKFGVKLLDLSKSELQNVRHPLLKDWPLPKAMFETDCLITLPKLKIHPRTIITGALKNQWGCIPQNKRFYLHRHLNELLTVINGYFKPKFAIMDAIVGMEGRGPAMGNPVELNMILGSRDIVALDATAMRLIGINPVTSGAILYAAQNGLGEMDANHIKIDGEFIVHPLKPYAPDFAMKAMDLLSIVRNPIVELILFNDLFFRFSRLSVNFLRKVMKRGN